MTLILARLKFGVELLCRTYESVHSKESNVSKNKDENFIVTAAYFFLFLGTGCPSLCPKSYSKD